MPEDRLSIRLLQLLAVLLGRLYHRTHVLSPQRLPRTGPAILVCNHISGLDPLLIQAVCPRLIVWMMASEYYQIKAMKWLYEAVDAIPVERSGRDMAATRAALRALGEGRILGVFPEGKIEPSRDLLPFQSGVAMLAMKARVPVYPAYLDGTQRGLEMLPAILTPNEANLSFGPPIEFQHDQHHQHDQHNGRPEGRHEGKRHESISREQLQAATDRIQKAVDDLRRHRRRGR